MATFQSTSYPPEFSTDGTTWKTLICVTDWEYSGSNSINKEDTFCGQVVGVGVPGLTGSANAVCDSSVSSTQVTYEDALGWFVGATKIKFRSQNASGTDWYMQCDCYITSIQQTFAAGSVVKFSINWESTGTLDNTP